MKVFMGLLRLFLWGIIKKKQRLSDVEISSSQVNGIEFRQIKSLKARVYSILIAAKKGIFPNHIHFANQTEITLLHDFAQGFSQTPTPENPTDMTWLLST